MNEHHAARPVAHPVADIDKALDCGLQITGISTGKLEPWEAPALLDIRAASSAAGQPFKGPAKHCLVAMHSWHGESLRQPQLWSVPVHCACANWTPHRTSPHLGPPGCLPDRVDSWWRKPAACSFCSTISVKSGVPGVHDLPQRLRATPTGPQTLAALLDGTYIPPKHGHCYLKDALSQRRIERPMHG